MAAIRLPTDLLNELHRIRGEEPLQDLIERIVRSYVRAEIDERDRQLIDAAADRLNAEAEDVLRYQSFPEGWVALELD